MKFDQFKEFSQPDAERKVLAFWDTYRVFHESHDLAVREGRPQFVFYEGPPTANGRPGIHHVISRTIKDLVCRYKTMQGFRVDRKAGWDTHGLPVEIEVEKALGLGLQSESASSTASPSSTRNAASRSSSISKTGMRSPAGSATGSISTMRTSR